MHQERIREHVAEKCIEVPVPRVMETIKAVKFVPQKRVRSGVMKQIGNATSPRTQGELVVAFQREQVTSTGLSMEILSGKSGVKAESRADETEASSRGTVATGSIRQCRQCKTRR